MKINGTRYTFIPDGAASYGIYANGMCVGWSLGNLAAAKTVAREIARSAA